jgi:CRP-like cAMP-binding protein
MDENKDSIVNLSEIFRTAQEFTFKKGDILYREGDQPESVYYLESGLVALLRSSIKGQEHILRIFHPGRTVGHRSMVGNEPYHATAKCLETCRGKRLGKRDFFQKLEGQFSLSLALMQLLSRELRRSEIRRMMNTDADVSTRVASSLLTLKKLYPDHLWTRTEIANFIASRTPTVIKTLGDFERQGLISQEGREIKILDEERLRAITIDVE